MSDVHGFPFFSGAPAAEPLRVNKRCLDLGDDTADPIPTGGEMPGRPTGDSAIVLPFPPSRDTRLIADLVRLFVDLRERHGRRCRSMLLARRFKPIEVRLRRMGVSAAAIERELSQLEAAVARLVWIADGRPRYGSGGGSAA